MGRLEIKACVPLARLIIVLPSSSPMERSHPSAGIPWLWGCLHLKDTIYTARSFFVCFFSGALPLTEGQSHPNDPKPPLGAMRCSEAYTSPRPTYTQGTHLNTPEAYTHSRLTQTHGLHPSKAYTHPRPTHTQGLHTPEAYTHSRPTHT